MAEGGVDTDSLLDKDGNPNMGDDDDAEEIELDQFKPGSSSSRRGSEGVAHAIRMSTSHDRTHEETSFGGRGESSMGEWSMRVKEREKNVVDRRIREKFPKADLANPRIVTREDEFKRIRVKLRVKEGAKREAKEFTLLDADGEVDANEKINDTILKILGPTAEEVVEANEEKITKATTRLTELRSALETADENQREDLNRQITEQENEIDGLERENEAVEQHMSLRDRIKAIFKKYGFTLIGVLTAVGTVIGVIVSNLKQGLTTLGKGVGSALKSIGKKLGEILPGLVGAIASFVFKTAGEVIGFLGKNAWLLIVGVVVFLIERLKKNTR